MNNDAIFDDISIMGRVIYIIYVIEIYIKETKEQNGLYRKHDNLFWPHTWHEEIPGPESKPTPQL